MKKILAGVALISVLALGTGCANNPTLGTVGGAAVGGVAGNVLTGGSAIGTAAGAVGGAVVGNQLSR